MAFGEARAPEAQARAGRASPERLPRAAGATVEDGVSGRTGIGGTRRLPGGEQPAFMIGSRSAELIEAGGRCGGRDRMDGGSRDPSAGRDKALAGREASMDDKRKGRA